MIATPPRHFIFLGPGDGHLVQFFDRLAGGFGSGQWHVTAWDPRPSRALLRTLRTLTRAGATTALVYQHPTAGTFAPWLAALPPSKIILATDLRDAPAAILDHAPLARVHQLFLKPHWPTNPLAEAQAMERLRAAAHVQVLA